MWNCPTNTAKSLVIKTEMAVRSFLPITEQENSSHPDGSDGNCSGVSKPGWSSHWGSVLGFNVSEECSLSLE